MRNRRLVVTVASGAIALGAVGAVAYPAFADSPGPTPTAGAAITPAPGPGNTAAGPARTDRIKDALKGLVTDGTLTQDQADKVAAELGAADLGGPGGLGHRGGRPGFEGMGPQELATALGLSVDDVRTGLESGKTVKDLATAQGKNVDDVITALVSAATTKIDQAVKNGTITQDRADKIKADLKARVTDFVNNGRPGPGDRQMPGGGLRHGPANPKGTPATPSPSGSSATDSSFITTA